MLHRPRLVKIIGVVVAGIEEAEKGLEEEEFGT